MIKEGGGKAKFDTLFLHNKILNLVKNKACETLQSKNIFFFSFSWSNFANKCRHIKWNKIFILSFRQ